jgi:hypothetical protein
MEFKTFTAQDTTGRVLPAATANVYTAGTTTPVTVYDENGVALSQPLTASASGGFGFEAVNGVYDVAITSGVETQTIENVQFYDPNNIQDSRFVDRASLVAGWVEDSVADGVIVSDGTVFYKAVSGSTAIADLPGLVPFCPVGWCAASPEHFLQYSASDMTAGIQAAIDYCAATFGSGTFGQGAVVGLLSKTYTVADDDADGYALVIANSVSLKGQGENSTQITINDQTDVTLYVGKGEAAILADTNFSATVMGVLIQDLQMFNNYAGDGTTSGSAPTAGAHIRADRSVVHIDRCHLINHYRGVEFLGTPESCRLTNSQITQGSNNGATGIDVEALSAGVAVMRRQMRTPTLDYVSETAAFTVGATLTGASSGATAIIRAVTDSGTTGTLTLSNLSATAFTDDEVITDGSGGSATMSGNITKGPGSLYQDPTDNLYYVEPNSVYITNNNIRVGALSTQNGGDYALLVGAVDGLYAANNHFAWGTTASIGFAPQQNNIGFGNITIVGGLIDPLPSKSQYGVIAHDRFSAGSSVMGSIVLSSVSIAGCVLDGVRLSVQCRRFQMNGGEIKGCGRYGVNIDNLTVTDTLINGVHIYNTDSDATGTEAAVYLVSGQRTTISNCAINNSSRGIQVFTDAQRTSILGNKFEAMTSGVSIFLQEDTDIAACYGNDVEETKLVGSAAALNLPVGADKFRITGTTNINNINATGAPPYDGRVVTLVFEDALDVTNLGNIATGGTITTSADDVLRLVYDATSVKWLKISFSAN